MNSPNENDAARVTAILRLFLALEREPAPGVVADYVEATEDVPLIVLQQAVMQIIKTRKREDGFPYPADVDQSARKLAGIESGRSVNGYIQPAGSWSKWAARNQSALSQGDRALRLLGR